MSSERELNQQLEDLVGIDRAFKLVRLWTQAEQIVSGDRYRADGRPYRSALDVFKRLAINDGYPQEAIKVFLQIN